MAAGRAEPSDRGFYVYGIVGTERPELTGATGVDGRSAVFMHDEDGLGAIVSEVPLAEFGEDALRRNLEELSWVAEKVRAHEEVLERAAREAPVLPLRFGTIYRSLDGLRELLTQDRGQLASTLEELRGKREWGVTCVIDRERLSQAVHATDPRAAQLAEAAEGKPAGTAYLGRKRLERHLGARADELATRLTATAHERLAAVAHRAVREGSTRLKGAYLVEEGREDDFRQVLEELGRDYEQSGIRFELTGPWPPYSFVGERTG
jgi:Gas vesicle synthesis protein GvpL/GvpF